MIEKNELSILLFGQNINRILNKKVDIYATFLIEQGLDKMHLYMVS
jgi:hypothetical protein